MLKGAIFLTLLGYAFAAKKASVYLYDPTGANNVTGTVIFTKQDNSVSITGEIVGLAPGNHGFHVHNLGNVVSDCAASGAHFNPHNLTHGAPSDTNRHVGDLGNIVANDSGVASIDFSDSVIDLEGQHSIIGRAIVVHENADDLGKGEGDSLTTGNAGNRLACGVVGILEDGDFSSSSTQAIASYLTVTAAFILLTFMPNGLF